MNANSAMDMRRRTKKTLNTTHCTVVIPLDDDDSDDDADEENNDTNSGTAGEGAIIHSNDPQEGEVIATRP